MRPVTYLLLGYAARLDPVRPAADPRGRAGRHPQHRLGQHRRDQRAAHRQQGLAAATLLLDGAEGRGRRCCSRAGSAGTGRRCRARRRRRARAHVPGLARLPGRQGRRDRRSACCSPPPGRSGSLPARSGSRWRGRARASSLGGAGRLRRGAVCRLRAGAMPASLSCALGDRRAGLRPPPRQHPPPARRHRATHRSAQA